jgi:uncharacterized membrane protein
MRHFSIELPEKKSIMEKFLILTHVLCGGTALLLGLIQLVNRKGRKAHVLIGKVYVGAMWWICLSAFLIISFYRFSAFLLVIGVLTFYSSFVGVRVIRRKTPGNEKWYDWLVAILTALFGLGLVGYGVNAYTEDRVVLAVLCGIFGFLTFNSARKDIWFFVKKNPDSKSWWLRQHIGAMGGSYIAACTAFAVQNPDFFMPDSPHQWLLWLIPTLIGTPLINIAQKRYRSEKLEKVMA